MSCTVPSQVQTNQLNYRQVALPTAHNYASCKLESLLLVPSCVLINTHTGTSIKQHGIRRPSISCTNRIIFHIIADSIHWTQNLFGARYLPEMKCNSVKTLPVAVLRLIVYINADAVNTSPQRWSTFVFACQVFRTIVTIPITCHSSTLFFGVLI